MTPEGDGSLVGALEGIKSSVVVEKVSDPSVGSDEVDVNSDGEVADETSSDGAVSEGSEDDVSTSVEVRALDAELGSVVAGVACGAAGEQLVIQHADPASSATRMHVRLFTLVVPQAAH